MFRYGLAALALKAFSATASTKQLYRKLGNRFGARRRAREGLPPYYMKRARNIVEQVRRLELIRPGDHLLEIGSGWLAWESTILRLFFDVQVTLFDVWDNRQFASFQRYFRDFAALVDEQIPMSREERSRVHSLLERLAKTTDWAEAYGLLGHEYVVDPDRVLAALPSNTYDLVFSTNVLEHIPRTVLREEVADFVRVLRPGGHSLHVIDLGDHLAYNDDAISCYKNYLRYSERTWHLFFENDVQHFNRVQPAEWLAAFADAGLVLVDQSRTKIDLRSVQIAAAQFREMDPVDLACGALTLLHQKPRCTNPRLPAAPLGGGRSRAPGAVATTT